MRKLASIIALTMRAATRAAGSASAAKKKPTPKPKGKVTGPAAVKEMSKENAKALAEFQGAFKWGLSPDEVQKLLADQIKPAYDEKIAATKDTYTQDQIRKRYKDELKRLKDSYLKFDGNKTPWDVSIIDREFSHNNGESMLLWKKLDETRYYFFVDDKLWKIYIAFDAKKFGDKTFSDFRQIFEAQFGASTVVERTTASGKIVLDEFRWPPAGQSILRAVDMSRFHGNYCLSIGDKDVTASIDARRKENNPDVKKGNTIVDSVTGKGGTSPGSDTDSNENVLDDIVGKKGP